jgi:hypothetical protein
VLIKTAIKIKHHFQNKKNMAYCGPVIGSAEVQAGGSKEVDPLPTMVHTQIKFYQ